MSAESLLPLRDLALRLVQPIVRAIDSPQDARALLLDLGYAPPDEVRAFGDLKPAIGVLVGLLDGLEDAVTNESSERAARAVVELLGGNGRLLRSLNDVPTKIQQEFAGSPFIAQTDILTALPRKLTDYVAVRYLERNHGTLYAALALAGVIELEDVVDAPTPSHVPYRQRTVHWDRLPELLNDPVATLKANLEVAEEILYYRVLFLLSQLAVGLGLPAGFRSPDDAVLTALNRGADLTTREDYDELVALEFWLLDDPVARVSIDVYPLLDVTTGKHTGLALASGAGTQLEIPLSDAYRLQIKASPNLGSGLGLRLPQDGDVSFLSSLFDSPAELAVATFGNTFSIVATELGPADKLLSLGAPGGARFEIGSGSLSFGVEKLNDMNLFVEADLKDGLVALKPTEADGFVSKLLPAEGIIASFSLGIGVSNRAGLYFKGASGLYIRLPLHFALGPVNIDYLGFGFGFENGRFPLTVTSGLRALLGPLAAVVEDIGVRAILTVKPDRSGNFGPLDVSYGFKPPKGVGLSMGAVVIKGGGYLYIDAERGEYAGALELTFSNAFALKAIGLITTKMPDGSRGFSLLIIITAEFATGIQLGFGFTLLAVGGLIGLNRTMKLQPLMEGVRTGAVNGIMFPRDVVANAPRIISDLRAIFPPQEGTFLIGPMAKLAWGTPPLISISLGIIIEIPGNVAILGVMRMALPADEVAVLVLQVNFAGAIEFDKKRIYFFAALFESRMLFIPIDGEMALLVAFGDDPNFVASVGGFHPGFSPPPLPVPSPRRISATIVNSPSARVLIDGYFALTPNTAQFGARAELFFGLEEISVRGNLGFDALLRFSPFYFIVPFSASFSVDVFGMGLFSARISGSLEGPTPWRASGEGSISLLFFNISVDFALTWGESRDTLLPPLAVMPLFKAEFEKNENWRALLPASNNLLVSLRKMPAEEAALVLHPVGMLRVTQRALPLELKLDKVGNQKPNDVNRLSVAVANGTLSKKGDTFEQFAPAQFENLSDGDRLSRPAFEPERAGLDLSVAGEDLRSSGMVKRVVRYEEVILDTNFKRFARRFFPFSSTLFDFFLNGASVVKSDLSLAKKKQSQPFEEKIEVQPETYTVAYQSNNTAYAADSVSFASEASARDFLAREVAKDANLAETLHVIPGYEVVA